MEEFPSVKNATISEKKWCPPYAVPESLTDKDTEKSNESKGLEEIPAAKIYSYDADNYDNFMLEDYEETGNGCSFTDILMCKSTRDENIESDRMLDIPYNIASYTNESVNGREFCSNTADTNFASTSQNGVMEEMQFFDLDNQKHVNNNEMRSNHQEDSCQFGKRNQNCHFVTETGPMDYEEHSSMHVDNNALNKAPNDSSTAEIDVLKQSENISSSVNMFEAFSMALGLDPDEEQYVQNINVESSTLSKPEECNEISETAANMDCNEHNEIEFIDYIKNTNQKSSQITKKRSNKRSATKAVPDAQVQLFQNKIEKASMVDLQREMKPFNHNYNQAAKRNRLRYDQQLVTGEVSNTTHTYLQMKGQKRNTRENRKRETLKTLRRAYELTKITLAIIEKLNPENGTDGILSLLERYSKLILTPRCQLFAHHSILALNECRKCERYPKKIRKLAEFCYKHCKSMFLIPLEETYESMLVKNIIKKVRSSVKTTDVWLKKLKDSLNESFDSECSND